MLRPFAWDSCDMNERYFEEYKDLAARGLKKAAGEALARFIGSFRNDEERIEWTVRYLDRLCPSKDWTYIRFELYNDVLFPALIILYRRKDPRAPLWLALTSSTSGPGYHDDLADKTHKSLLLEAYVASGKSDDTRNALLTSILEAFDYKTHEWPSGILMSADDTFEGLRSDLRLASKLDESKRHEAEILRYQEMVDLYEERLRDEGFI